MTNIIGVYAASAPTGNEVPPELNAKSAEEDKIPAVAPS